MHTVRPESEVAKRPAKISRPTPAHSEQSEQNSVIAKLVEQLRAENQRISELMERQRKLRLELLRAQEESLASLRSTNS